MWDCFCVGESGSCVSVTPRKGQMHLLVTRRMTFCFQEIYSYILKSLHSDGNSMFICLKISVSVTGHT